MSRSPAHFARKQKLLVLENTERISCHSNELRGKVDAQALTFAPSVRANCMEEQLAKILAVMAPYMRWRDKGRHVCVTDETVFGDFFGLTDEVAVEIGAKLGFAITLGDYLVDVATQMIDADNPA
jgi:hypothetical protein